MLTLYEKTGHLKPSHIGARSCTYNSSAKSSQDRRHDGATDRITNVAGRATTKLTATTFNLFAMNDSKEDLKKVVAGDERDYTDTWVDMKFFTNPDYAEKKNQIINMMMPYQIDAALMEGTDTMVFHDMPIHPGYEITQDVMEKHLETILDEAENRRHAEKGLLVYLITGKLDV